MNEPNPIATIKETMTAKGLSYGDLLKKSGIQPEAFFFIMQGAIMMPWEIRNIAKALDISAEILVNLQKNYLTGIRKGKQELKMEVGT